ncbi:hypothetical protein BIY26_03875 [Brenneria goodwinii]|uniref:DUF7683 domain-containing protein n=1 Tax=Brenneria goodwinii TaxID=1109412 RepID=A0AAE8EVD7_9GAMM|nr:hypothetical protein [Brenneria goodwinii]ATA23806.1 hypothetical protein AWC36_06630 [Brenneria goodwinii]RLM28472.1 hypothetical protein BIY26_03875 [Brenneria goodwinii]
MIIYTIDAYSKTDEDLLFEVDIPADKLAEVAQIMGWSEEDKTEFSLGIGVYNINKNQALCLEKLLDKKFYSSDLTLQLSGGSI